MANQKSLILDNATTIERHVQLLMIERKNTYLSSNLNLQPYKGARNLWLPDEGTVYISVPFRALEVTWHNLVYSYKMERCTTDYIFAGGYYKTIKCNTHKNLVNICPERNL